MFLSQLQYNQGRSYIFVKSSLGKIKVIHTQVTPHPLNMSHLQTNTKTHRTVL